MADDTAGLGWTADFAGAMSPACNTCSHVFMDYASCEAFPNGIPLDIIKGRFRHLTPHAGDHVITYEHEPTLGPKPAWAP
ncbi:MAG: hypothetical protein ABR941_10925 [Thermoleophilia bacterium]